MTKNITLIGLTDTAGNKIAVNILNGMISAEPDPKAEIVDCEGLVVLPGLVDLHTHLREPGFEQSETVLTGSMAAACGGYTAIHAMANTFPVADSAGVVEQIKRLGDDAGYCEVQPIGAVTVGLRGEQLAELGAMANSRAQVRIFSDDGNCVHDPALMRRALEYVRAFNGVIAQHAQEPKLTVNAQMNEGKLSSALGLAGWPSVAEEAIIARDIMLAAHTGSRLHICHLSTAGSVELVRSAKAKGVAVTAEVTPHHLVLTEQMAENYDPIYKVNPPLRTLEDTMALRAGLIDGTIDVIATDHAPHPKESKDTEWAAAAFGMVGLEAAYAVAQEVLIDSGASDFTRLAEVTSISPAQISGLSNQGNYLKIGSIANLAIVDPNQVWTAQAETHSLSTNNPYQGRTMHGRVRHTIFSGEFTYRDFQIQKKVIR
ncbi:MAG: dihydroorotase [Actinomycetota bacterium]